MSKGEKAQLEIEPEWAYGKKGQPDAKYPSPTSYSLSSLEVPAGMKCFMAGGVTGGHIHLFLALQAWNVSKYRKTQSA